MGEKLFGKVVIKGRIKLKTGLHIGAQTESIEIGGIDNPILKNPVSGEPYIPGSSLKGKMRNLFEKIENMGFNRNIGPNIRIHACENFEDAKKCKICRLFGSSGTAGNTNHPARAMFRDAHLVTKYNDIDEIIEVKYETGIDRITSAANPRPMERVVPNTEFALEIVYNVEDEDEKKEDIENLIRLMKLLEDDYLGGSGSRGYGKVEFYLTEITERSRSYYLESDEENTIFSSESGVRPENLLKELSEKL